MTVKTKNAGVEKKKKIKGAFVSFAQPNCQRSRSHPDDEWTETMRKTFFAFTGELPRELDERDNTACYYKISQLLIHHS